MTYKKIKIGLALVITVLAVYQFTSEPNNTLSAWLSVCNSLLLAVIGIDEWRKKGWTGWGAPALVAAVLTFIAALFTF